MMESYITVYTLIKNCKILSQAVEGAFERTSYSTKSLTRTCWDQARGVWITEMFR